jgi:General secretion pathway, M protein.
VAKKNSGVPYLVTDHVVLRWFSNIAPRVRWAISGGIVFLLVVVWILFLYLPLVSKVEQCQYRIKNNESQSYKLKSVLDHWPKRNPFHAPKPDGTFVDALIALARDSSVVCSRIAPVEKGYEAEVKGTFDEIEAFLSQLYTIPFGMVVKKLICERLESSVTAHLVFECRS